MKKLVNRLSGWLQYRSILSDRNRCEAHMIQKLPVCHTGELQNKRILLDASWDNPNYWLRVRLFQASLGFFSSSSCAYLGKWTARRCPQTLKKLGFHNHIIADKISVPKSILRDAAAKAKECETGENLLQTELLYGFYPDFLYDRILKTLRVPSLLGVKSEKWKDIFINAYIGVYRANILLERTLPELLILSHPFGEIDGPLLYLAMKRNIPAVLLLAPYGKNFMLKYRVAEDQRISCCDVPSGEDISRLRSKEYLHFLEIGQRVLKNRMLGQAPDIGSQYAYGTKGVKKIHAKTKDIFPQKEKTIVSVFASNWFDFPHAGGMKNFEDFYVWIKETLEIAIKSDHCNWLFRGHPCDAWYGGITLRTLFEQYDLPSHVKICPEEIGTAIVLEESDAFITIQGTVGLEATALGKPVLSADASWYTDCGFVKFAKSREEYLKTLKTEWWKDWDTEKAAERAKVFAGIYFGLPKWQKEFIQEDDSVQWDIYKRMPAMLERAKDEIEIEKECIRRWWASDHRFFHTWKMLNCYECLPEIEPENRF